MLYHMTVVAYKLKTKFNDNSFKLRLSPLSTSRNEVIQRPSSCSATDGTIAVPTFTDAAAACGGVSPKQAKQKVHVQ